MRTNRRTALILLLTAAICLGLVPVCAEGPAMLFEDSFDSYATGNTPRANWEISAENNLIDVAGVPDQTDKSARFSVLRDGSFYLQKSTLTIPTSKQVVYEASVMQESKTGSLSPFMLRDFKGTIISPVTFSNGAVTLFDGSILGKYIENKFYKVVIAADYSNKTMSVWFNGKKRVKNYSFSNTKLDEPALFRMYAFGSPGDVMYLNDVKVYEGTQPLSQEPSEQEREEGPAQNGKSMENAIALYENRRSALVYGFQKKIDENPAVTPFRENGTLYVPLRFLASTLGAAVSYDGTTQSTEVSYQGQKFTLREGAEQIESPEGSFLAGAAVLTREDRMFLPLEAACRVFGKKVFQDHCGLVVFSDTKDFLSWEEDLKFINEFVKSFIYETYDGDTLIEMLKAKNPDRAHPRIMATAGTFERLKRLIKEDEICIKIWQGVRESADNLLKQPVNTYRLQGSDALLSVARSILSRVADLAFAYRMTGDEKYAERAWMELYMAAMFPDWSPGHTLDTGEMSAAFAIGYDWLYDWFSEDQRQILRTAMIQKGLTPLSARYDENLTPWTNNWAFVCNGGTAMAALAIGDEEAPELCGKILSCGLESIETALSAYAPDGAWDEGVVYWNYATKYLAFHISSLDNALGTDLGRFDVPGIRKTADTVQALNGSVESFNFSDTSSGANMNSAMMTWLANKLQRPEIAKKRMEAAKEKVLEDGPLDLIWYKEEFGDAKGQELPYDNYARRIETVTMRGGWDKGDTFVGLHAGDNAAPHSHLDMGSFVMDSQGQRFFLDLGADNYDLGHAHTLYRGRAEGHNCLVINPNGKSDQSSTANCVISAFESKPKGAFAISDITSAYSENTDKAVRGIMLTEDRKSVIVQDELELPSPSEVYWFAHTKADIRVAEDGQSAVLTKGGKMLLAKILEAGSGAEFTVMEAKSMFSTLEGEAKNEGVQKLAIHMKDYSGGTISVGFTPLYEGETPYDFGEVIPLDEWSVPDGEIQYANAGAVYLDGAPLGGFSPEIESYTIELPEGAEHVPQVTADGAESVLQAKNTSGTAVVKVSGEGKSTRHYTITFWQKKTIGVPEGMKTIPVTSVQASAVPQPENKPENTIDKNLSTRWSAENTCWIQYDLGSVKRVDGVSVAFMSGDARKANIKLEVSVDGKQYTTVFEGLTSGTTSEMEAYLTGGVDARYVRLNCYGTTAGSWNSVTEAAIFQK